MARGGQNTQAYQERLQKEEARVTNFKTSEKELRSIIECIGKIETKGDAFCRIATEFIERLIKNKGE